MPRTYNDVHAKIRETIAEHMPKDAEITRIEFEGPQKSSTFCTSE